MGVPAFFRWLSRKYPSIIVSCVEDKNAKDEDLLGPNPNEIEFDNLYLDMNGIIHPCCHPEYKQAPENEDEMMDEIFLYIDRLMNILRPRKLLYMAVDGVAPRAKMNQQRSRRFRASQESDEKTFSLAKVRAEIAAKGIVLPDEKNNHNKFDSNCITPGTPFMHKLSLSLRYYIQDRLSNHPAWKNLKVILSDANVPGEGEHKIMDYIRKQRANPDHDPNTHHCLCGADADLIMLGLATHEPHFTIIREEFKPNQSKPCDLCKQKGHELKDCKGAAFLITSANNSDAWSSSMDETDDPLLEEGLPVDTETTFLFIRLDVLRQYLERELLYDYNSRDFANNDSNHNNYNNYSSGNNSSNDKNRPSLRCKNLELERVLDDWVFLCFFVGNDFLPHLPSLEIRENAIDRLVRIYKETQTTNQFEGYLTCNGSVNLKSAQIILSKLGNVEDSIFTQRQENELRFKRREEQEDLAKDFSFENSTFHSLGKRSYNPMNSNTPVKFVPAGATAKDIKNANSNKFSQLSKKNSSRNDDDDDEDDDKDSVRLHEEGFKDRYYAQKFGIDSNDLKFRNDVAIAYAKGLCWVLLYYYQGCPCWNWFFPYHYAPFASDFLKIDKKITNRFDDKKQPFKPLEQLMSVFPASSGIHIPTPWAELMTIHDSPILDFYPTHFKIDLNGKRFAWQGVALLPFVEEERLLRTLKERVYDKLTPFEQILNSRSFDRLYVSEHHPAYAVIKSILATDPNLEEIAKKDFMTLNTVVCQGMAGLVKPDLDFIRADKEHPGQLISLQPDVPKKPLKAVGIFYKDPAYPDTFVFEAKLLPNVNMPLECLKPLNWDENRQGRYRPPLGFGNNVTTLERPRQQIAPSGRRLMNSALNNAVNFNYNQAPQRQSRGGPGSSTAPPPSYDRSLSFTGDRTETRRRQQQNNNNYLQQPPSQYQTPHHRTNHGENERRQAQPGGGGGMGNQYFYSPRPPGAMGNSPNPRLRILQRNAMAYNYPPPPLPPRGIGGDDAQNYTNNFESSNFNWQQRMMSNFRPPNLIGSSSGGNANNNNATFEQDEYSYRNPTATAPSNANQGSVYQNYLSRIAAFNTNNENNNTNLNANQMPTIYNPAPSNFYGTAAPPPAFNPPSNYQTVPPPKRTNNNNRRTGGYNNN